MITEKHFALSHAAFWRQLLPTASSYLRECNIEAARFERPLKSTVPPHQRGMINETAFRLFTAGIRLGLSPSELPMNVVEESIKLALLHIEKMREYQREKLQNLAPEEIIEATDIANRLSSFFSQVQLSNLSVFPEFRGCGWIDTCRADILADGVLFEIKAGDRQFHSSDLRQTLCYCALNFSAKIYEINNICLVNPRTGKYFGETLERLCQRMAGRPAVEILSDIVEYISEPHARVDGIY